MDKKRSVLHTDDSVITGVETIPLWKPDLVFLDLQRPNENGFKIFLEVAVDLHFRKVAERLYFFSNRMSLTYGRNSYNRVP